MTNMTRRNFLKSAGVMTLAVAAAGVLSGCDSSSKNPVMEDVKVEYWREKSQWYQDLHIGDGAYDETVSVVKGSEKFKKELLKNLGSACSGSTTYDIAKVADEIAIDRSNPEKLVAKVYLQL